MFEATNLHVGYGQSEVIHNVSFKTEPNEILAIMGRNGMGKTTLLKSLLGILPTRSGSIKLGSQELTSKQTHERVASGLAYVPQGRMIFSSLTVFENMITGAKSTPTKKTLEEIYGLFPVLFDMRKRKGGNLSGGQQQQLAIARALITEPKVLILDEPTEGIQPSIIKDIAKSLKQIRDMRNLTIIVSEQVLSFVLDACDRLFVMERGRFIHEDLRANVDAEKVKKLLSV